MTDPVDERLARMESQLSLVLQALHARRKGAAKRGKTVAARALQQVESEPEQFQPSDIQRAHARRLHKRYDVR